MLDPQMVGEGYWVWEGGGPWRDVPLSNYAGWLVSSAGVMVLLELLLPVSWQEPPAARPSTLVGRDADARLPRVLR
jgi:putative membrane protein